MLDYGTLLSNVPIKTIGGTIIPPTLLKIRKEIGFDIFSLYEMYLRVTPKLYFYFLDENGKEKWDNMNEEQRATLTMYDLILEHDDLRKAYEELFNFFFLEEIVFVSGFFVSLKEKDVDYSNLSFDDVVGVIHKDNFEKIRIILQQVCGFDVVDEENKKPPVFKNNRAKELYEKIYGDSNQKSDEEDDFDKKEIDYDLTIPNIISVISNCHPTISPLNIWELTIFQLVDSFHRTMQNKTYEINKTSFSVWGDEENKFQSDQWLKNRFKTNNDGL